MDVKKEAYSTLKYVVVGILLSVVINQGLGYALGTEKPIMAVVSNSMVPTFSRGDLIVVKGIDPAEIKIGDIIVYSNPKTNIPIVHRVIDIIETPYGRRFITKGDSNGYSDQASNIAPPVREEWVKGKVIEPLIIPKLGYFKVALLETTAFLNKRL